MKAFIYGTLREGHYNYDLYLKGKVNSSQKAYVKGILYTIKDKVYPALVEGERWISGELMEIVDDSVLQQLDQLEGYHGEGDITNMYNRYMMEIVDENYQPLGQYPVYLYNHKNPELQGTLGEIIEENDYCIYMQKKV